MTITPAQNKQMHLLLNQAKMTAHKADLVNSFTTGRTESSREMLASEAQELITYLKSLAPASPGQQAAENTMRRKVLALCHRMKWTVDGTTQVDMQRLNLWCVNKSYLNKPLQAYKYNELPKLVSQVTAVYRSFLKSTTI